MREFFGYYKENITKLYGFCFGVFGAVSVIFPLDSISSNNITERMIIFLGICLAIAIVSILVTYIKMNTNQREVYVNDKAKIIFEYNDFNEIIRKKYDEKVTIVVPINTDLTVVNDVSVIREGSIHKLFLDFVKENGGTFNIDTLKKNRRKSMVNTTEIGRIGDWFFLEGIDLEIDTNIRFLLIEVNRINNAEGFSKVETLSKEEYFGVLAVLLRVIQDLLNQEEKVYLPLIGAGNARVGKNEDVLFFLEEVLRFYKDTLFQEIHVVLNKKYKKELGMYRLRDIE